MSKPWLMANEPIDLEYDTWFPTDCLSANVRQIVSVIFSEPTGNANAGGSAGAAEGGEAATAQEQGEVAQSMEVDQVSDGKLIEKLTYSDRFP